MSEDNVQNAPGDKPYVERPPVEKAVAQEAAAEQPQDQPTNPEVGDLIAESKKYRARSQKAEAELAQMQKQAEAQRTKELEAKKEWQTLAEERAARLAELEPIVERAMKDEAQMREQILNDFSIEDRETFGDLPMAKLRALHGKIVQQPKVAIANNPAVPANEVQGDWTQMSEKERKKNWPQIIERYRRAKT
tara:strand:+ start:744 stop:1319 length:576 start_codon:yes stop_codon:yes gene_type:complete